MKYLIIDHGQAYYSLDGSLANKKAIDKISKEDLISLLRLVVSDEFFEMDPYTQETLHNAAHQIIYKNIYQKFDDLKARRVSFQDEKIGLYRAAINKYSAELSAETQAEQDANS